MSHDVRSKVNSAKNVIEVDAQSFEQEVLGSPVPVLVDFWAERCAPCKLMRPDVEAVAESYVGRAKVVAIDADAEPVIAERYAVRGLPTLLVFRHGEVVGQLVGAMPRRKIAGLLDDAMA